MRKDSNNQADGEAASGVSPRFVEFDDFRIDTVDGLLYRNGQQIKLPRQAFTVLHILIRNNGRLVTKEQFMKEGWPGTTVEEGNLTVYISALRKTLGKKYIETFTKKGYLFRAALVPAGESNAGPGVGGPPDHQDGIDKEGVGPTQELTLTGGQTADEKALAASPRPKKGVRVKLSLMVVVIVTGLSLAAWYVFTRQRDSPPPVKSIAILPFKSLGAEVVDKDLAVMITDAIITKLSNLRRIQVRPTSAVLKYHDEGTSSLEAGRLEKADAVLEGTIQREGGKIRVTAQLVQVRDGNSLWADTFDVSFTDTFTVQSVVSHRVAQALSLELAGGDQKLADTRHTENVDAYRLYLRGRYNLDEYTENNQYKAIELFSQALALDPNYAQAHAGIADAYWGLSNFYLPPKEAMPKAQEAALRALKIDNTLAEAHLSLALVQFRYRWEWEESEKSFKRAIELNPNYAFAHEQYGLFLAAMGRSDEALTEAQLAVELDPRALSPLLSLGDVLYYARRPDQSIEQHRKILEINPDYYLAHFYLGSVYAQTGNLPEAIAEYQKARQIEETPVILAGLGHAYAISGQRDNALKTMNKLTELSKRRWVSPYYIALIYAGLGEKDSAVKWLRKAYDERGEEVAFLKVEPKLDSLRSEPTFINLLQKLKLSN